MVGILPNLCVTPCIVYIEPMLILNKRQHIVHCRYSKFFCCKIEILPVEVSIVSFCTFSLYLSVFIQESLETNDDVIPDYTMFGNV